ncbi:hypothetical protein [Pseudomonas sp. S1(2024)]|uniref:hypothetical protein n=1 Tax=Pseudomonas sp. S1(2024) TaxID=3390191 RepID=UPI003979F418
MTTLENKSELQLLIQNPGFQALLEIDSSEAFLQRALEHPNQQFEYYAGKWDEEGAGVKLFQTPMRGNNCGAAYGTWLNVAKLYGSPDLPYRVQAAEYVPWGVEVDLENIGDFKTLGEALDCAFAVHEHGSIELDVRGFDAEGRYGKGDPRIDLAAGDTLSVEALAVNAMLEGLAERRQEHLAIEREKAQVRQMRYDVPVDFNHAPALLGLIKEKLKQADLGEAYSTHIELTASINKHLFADQGHLFTCYNNDLRRHQVEPDGATFVAIEVGQDLRYYNVDGMFETWEKAEASLVAHLTEIYKPQFQDLGDGGPKLSFCHLEIYGADGEDHEVYLDDNTLQPITDVPVLPEVDDLDPEVPEEVVADRIVKAVVHEYKIAREKRLQQALRDEGLSL